MYKVITDKDEFAIKLLNSEVMKRPTAVHNHTFAEKVANIAKKMEEILKILIKL